MQIPRDLKMLDRINSVLDARDPIWAINAEFFVILVPILADCACISITLQMTVPFSKWMVQLNRPQKLVKLSMSSAKDHNTVTNICNKSCTTSCNTVNSNNFDSSCNKIEVEICEDDQICQPLINELYKIPSNYVCVYNINVESDKSIRHKQLIKDKFVYPRVDPPPSDIIDNRNDDEKMASIIRTCQQILTKDELDCWNSLCERYLQNSTRYVSGIPKIRADMLKEIKDFRISEQEKQKLAAHLEKVPFNDL